jgi:1-acyl-sn-glycerol-3-phosphate acyltransferase
VRLRTEHLERLPRPPYLVCFNHLNWTDPFVIVVLWPSSPRVHFYGPREEDMTHGVRNALIGWLGTAVPFKPGKNDLLTSTRRAFAALRGGYPLAIAAEGRVGVDENDVLPRNPGGAFFAIRAAVPLVAVAINETRWLRFGKTVRVRVGAAIPTTGLRADAAMIDRVTNELHGQLREMVSDYRDLGTRGRFGRWLTEAFNERPVLDVMPIEAPPDLLARDDPPQRADPYLR